MMTVVLHFATALSTVVIFRKEVVKILKGLFQFKWNEETQFSMKILFSMIPAALIGVLLEKEMEAMFGGQIVLVSFCLVITGLLLFLANKAKPNLQDLSFLYALVVGISQAIAILPGISRSGATIASCVLLGVGREQAARFSFLMVVPLIFGKIGMDIFNGALTETVHVWPLTIGFVTAFLTGLLACKWMILLVKNSKLVYFSIYCFIIAVVAIISYLA